MRLDSGTLAKAASAALMVFGRHHPLTDALHMAMAGPTDLADIQRALEALPADQHRLFATAFHDEMMTPR